MIQLPTTLKMLHARQAAFEAWLTERGSSVQIPTNPYEAMRFMTPDGVGIIYRNEGGRITHWMNGADDAWRAFETNGSWRYGQRIRRPGGSRTKRLVGMIRKRDGGNCFFCDDHMPEDDTTLEHLLSLTHGGSNHPCNLALAHEDCNNRASHMSVVAKVLFRERARVQVTRRRAATGDEG